jgi:3-oxoacyl-[acyl-carrier protein] reductase
MLDQQLGRELFFAIAALYVGGDRDRRQRPRSSACRGGRVEALHGSRHRRTARAGVRGEQGLGRGCAEALAREGVHVTICARTRGDVERAAYEIGRMRRSPGGLRRVRHHAREARPRALRAVPGSGHPREQRGRPAAGDFREWDRDAWIRALDANMLTPIELIKATIDGMIARRFGRIVNITSSSVKAPIDVLGCRTARAAGSPASSPGWRARSRSTTSRSTTCCRAASTPIGCSRRFARARRRAARRSTLRAQPRCRAFPRGASATQSSSAR